MGKNYKCFIEALGWGPVGMVERWVSRASKRIDLFGFADYVAIVPGRRGTTFLQTTSGNGHGQARVKKILEDCSKNVVSVLTAGNFVEVWEFNRRIPLEEDGSRKRNKGDGKITKVRVWDALRWNIVLEFDALVAYTMDNYLVVLRKFSDKQPDCLQSV